MIPRARLSVISTLLSLGLCVNVAQAAWPHDPFTNVRLAPTNFTQSPHAAVPDGAGGAIVAFVDYRSGSADIYAQHVTAAGVVDGAWPATGLAVCNAAGDQNDPVMIADGAGGAIIAWTDQRIGGNGDIFGQRVTGAGTIAPGWPINGRQISSTNELKDEFTPQIVSDGSGGAIVVWTLAFAPGDLDIYGARVNSLGTVLWSKGLSEPLLAQSGPSVASDGAHGAIVAFEDNSAGNFDVNCLRADSSGNLPWGVRSIASGAGNQHQPVVATDGWGGAYLAWVDDASGSQDVLGAHLSSAGGFLATFSVSIAPGTQNNPLMIAVANHGAIVVFKDAASSTVSAHHIVSIGIDSSWPVNGLAISPSGLDRDATGIVSDGSGGAIVTWEDKRSFLFHDVYATRVTAAGVFPFPWLPPGTPVCTDPNNQTGSVVTSDGSNGAILAWTDFRLGTPNVFAQNIDRFAQLGDASPSFVSLRDVRGDQGGQVRLAWNASYLDADPDYTIGEYWVWRQTSPSLAADAVRAGARWLDEGPEPVGLPALRSAAPGSGRLFMRTQVAAVSYTWEFLAAQKASGFPQYSYVASTARDSLGGSNPYTAFMVQARAGGGVAFWNSAPDSTYSVDNLPPLPPSSLTGAYAGGATHLHWAPNHEADLAGYRLYRGTSAGFVPGPANLVASPPDTGYADPGAAGGFYKLSAVDIHGNESGFVLLTPSGTLDVGDETPREFALALASPNPARAAVSFRVSIPAPGRVSLAVYDAAGRLVRQLLDGELQAGERIEPWDGGDANRRQCANGLYFAVLHASNRKIVRRVVIAR